MNGAHTSGLLGPEEHSHHATLLQLEDAVRASLPAIAASGSSKTQAVMRDKQTQDRLAKMRFHIRDLELLAEEQDM
jgi:hypothetical protein